MINSLLLHFDCAPTAAGLIPFSVSLAARLEARIRGLTILDTRRLSTLATSCESAVHCTRELERLALVDVSQESLRAQLANACDVAGVQHDWRQWRGDPVALLPSEAQFHDLVVTAVTSPGEQEDLTPQDVVRLVERDAHPLLVLRPRLRVKRTLLVCDGEPSSASAIRQFLLQRLFPECELRLLAVGTNEHEARDRLHAMTDYAQRQRTELESGYLRGSISKALIPYAEKWQADLIVIGVTQRKSLFRPLAQQPVEQILRKTNLGVYTLG